MEKEKKPKTVDIHVIRYMDITLLPSVKIDL